MDPHTQEEWMQVATSRLGEARVIHENDSTSVGSAYLAGYGIECALKAYAAVQGENVRGHDLINLVKLAGLKVSVFKNDEWFLTSWSVDWRYLRRAEQLPRMPSECIQAAGNLQGYIGKQLKRRASRRQRRGR